MKNKEFLFIYDAANCNPNGDPDQENKPRMDRDTKTNLVTDTRLKRYIRDYLDEQGKNIFVSMVGGNKVSVETKLNILIDELLLNENTFNDFVMNHQDVKSEFVKLTSKNKKTKKKNNNDKEEPKYAGSYYEIYKKSRGTKEKDENNKVIDKGSKKNKDYEGINNVILEILIKERLIDIRFFGGAFAVGGFTKTITGPVQINMGYSLHPVELNPSNTIVTIMGDKEGQSGIGKKETLFYSLLAFTGTINSKKAEIVNLSDEDVIDFRSAIIKSLLSQRTDSKKNQYPRLYLEIEYNDGEYPGRLGDLRNFIEVHSKLKDINGKEDFTKVRNLEDLEINFSNLYTAVESLKNKIEKIRIWKSLDTTFNSFEIKGAEILII